MQCLIVDDDPLICDLLEHFCTKVDLIQQVTVCNSGFEAVNLIQQHHFDLLLLDYDLPDLTGKEILELIPTESLVIMITSHTEFASDSYNYDQIVDFLVKPIEFSRFYKGILKVKNQRNDKGSIFVKDGTSLVKIQIADIYLIKSAGNYAEIFLPGRKVMTLITLKELEKKLPEKFQRVHRSCIVNVDKIESISNGLIHLAEHEVALSSSYEEKLMNKINLLT